MTITKEFFLRDSHEVAPALLGLILCRRLTSGTLIKGMIVETEAYHHTDPASHTFKGKTPRNQSMFLEGGHIYVYFTYGMHFCMNLVTGPEGNGQGVLLRALEILPQTGSLLTKTDPALPPLSAAAKFPASGPGKICKLLEINKTHDGLILSPENGIWLEENPLVTQHKVLQSGRIGISVGVETQWRFFIESNRFVSGKTQKKQV